MQQEDRAKTPSHLLSELVDILDWRSGRGGRAQDEQRVRDVLDRAREWLAKRPSDEASQLISDILRGLDTSDDALLDGAIQRARALPLQRLKVALAHTTGPDDWAHVDAGALQWAIDTLSGLEEMPSEPCVAVDQPKRPAPTAGTVLDGDDVSYVQERLDRASHYFVGDGSADACGWQAGGEALGEAVERLAQCLAPPSVVLTRATRGST